MEEWLGGKTTGVWFGIYLLETRKIYPKSRNPCFGKIINFKCMCILSVFSHFGLVLEFSTFLALIPVASGKLSKNG